MSLDFDPRVDHYKALGVDKTASEAEIKKVYRKLAKQFHPDTTGGDKAKESRFKEISAAYEVLGDAKKRQQYDAIRAGGGRMPGGAGFPGGGPGAGGGVWDLGDLFGQMFAGGAGRGAGPGGRVRVERFDFDPGAGTRRGPDPAAVDADFDETIAASDGSALRLRGHDVHSDVRVSFDGAILGTIADVPTLDGRAQVKIPPGTSSGRRLRLRAKGPRLSTGGQGDHYVTVQIDVPTTLDDEALRLLGELVARLKKRSK